MLIVKFTFFTQVEEEEYTSRIIQHFSAGLLSLPESATLRSYLSDKLNCDPMRITKKFTGACCLGRRAYQLRDRPRATPAEVEMAKIELDHLEQRFRLRVEHEQSGLPLSRRQELLIAQPQANGGSGTLFCVQSCPPVAAAASVTSNPWLSNYAGVSGVPVNTSSLFMGSPANHSIQSVAAGMPVNPQSLFISLAGNRPMQPLPSASNPLRITSTTDGYDCPAIFESKHNFVSHPWLYSSQK